MNGKERVEALKALVFGVVILIALVVAAIGGAGWWLNENFGSTATLVIISVIIAASFLIIGMMLNQRNTRKTLEIAADFHADIMNTQVTAQKAHVEELRGYRELLRADAAQMTAQAKVSVIDHQAVEREAQRRAQAILAAERRALTGPVTVDATPADTYEYSMDMEDASAFQFRQ